METEDLETDSLAVHRPKFKDLYHSVSLELCITTMGM